MIITAEISMYPLSDSYEAVIVEFIRDLDGVAGLERVTNQLSTQLRGEYELVHQAIRTAMAQAMQAQDTVVFVVKYLNADLPIASEPSLGFD